MCVCLDPTPSPLLPHPPPSTPKVLSNIRKEAEKVKGGEDRIEEIVAAKMRDMGLAEKTGVLKIPEHCVVNSRVSLIPRGGRRDRRVAAYPFSKTHTHTRPPPSSPRHPPKLPPFLPPS